MLNSFKLRSLQNPLASLKERFYRFSNTYPFLQRFLPPITPMLYGDEQTLAHPSTLDEAVLILPPSDYWAIKTTLNVKNEKDAAKYGPALFDLDKGYSYDAQRVDTDTFVIIAYNRAELSTKIATSAIGKLIKKITFAQWVFSHENGPVLLPNGKYLTLLDGIVIEMDPAYLDTTGAMGVDEVLLHHRYPVKTVTIDVLSETDLTPKTLKTTLAIALILLANIVSNGIIEHQEQVHVEEAIQTVLDEFKLPETSIEREAMVATLRKKEEKQLQLRRQFLKISDIQIEALNLPPPASAAPSTSAGGDVVLIPGSKPGEPNRLLVGNGSSNPPAAVHSEGIQEMTYDGNGILLVMNFTDSQTRQNLKNEFSKRFKKVQLTERDSRMEARIK